MGLMNQQSVGARLFYGTAGILRPGDNVTSGASCSRDPAEALLDAWRAADETDQTPHVYEVALTADDHLTVLHDVPVDGRLAGLALDIAAQRSSNRKP